MSPMQEQLIALGAVFESAVLVDKVARTGQINEPALGCMLGSLLVRDPKDTLEVYGGDDLNLREGYRALVSSLERDPASLQREPLRYALALLALERQLAKRDDLLQIIIGETGTIDREAASIRSNPRSSTSAPSTKTSWRPAAAFTKTPSAPSVSVSRCMATCATCSNRATPRRFAHYCSPASARRGCGASSAATAGNWCSAVKSCSRNSTRYCAAKP